MAEDVSYKDNITVDLKEIGRDIVNWIHLGQDKVGVGFF
jgi:hypothetical protein